MIVEPATVVEVRADVALVRCLSLLPGKLSVLVVFVAGEYGALTLVSLLEVPIRFWSVFRFLDPFSAVVYREIG